MRRNMGIVDRLIRILIAILFIFLIYKGQVRDVLATVLGIVSAVFILTGLIGWCPLYTIFGINTGKKKS
jgi:nicotinamide riboside transporter PnuC